MEVLNKILKIAGLETVIVLLKVRTFWSPKLRPNWNWICNQLLGWVGTYRNSDTSYSDTRYSDGPIVPHLVNVIVDLGLLNSDFYVEIRQTKSYIFSTKPLVGLEPDVS